MQQKIQFITTVIHNPDLLILDEPFSGFDPVNAELLKKEILELKEKGKTIILSTHNMESVEELCDYITLINKSKAVLQGKVTEIRDQFKQHILKFRIAENNFDLESPLFELLSNTSYENYTEIRLQSNNETSNSDILKKIVDKYEVISFEEELPTMNDIFIQTVTKQ